MTKLICSWCRKEFEVTITKDKRYGERSLVICPHCARRLPSSKIKQIDGVARKHIHTEYKDGDIAG